MLDKSNARQTIRFLEGFAQQCECGMVVHHLQREFSLSSLGFDTASRVREEVELPSELVKFGED